MPQARFEVGAADTDPYPSWTATGSASDSCSKWNDYCLDTMCDITSSAGETQTATIKIWVQQGANVGYARERQVTLAAGETEVVSAMFPEAELLRGGGFRGGCEVIQAGVTAGCKVTNVGDAAGTATVTIRAEYDYGLVETVDKSVSLTPGEQAILHNMFTGKADEGADNHVLKASCSAR